MTSSAQQVRAGGAGSPRMGSVTRAFAGAPWSVWLFGVLCLAAFWRTGRALLPLLGLDTAEGLAPVMPFLAMWFAAISAAHRAESGAREIGERDPVIDVGAASILLAIAAWLLWRLPVQDGWYFWAGRLDLLALPCFALGCAILLWGLQTVLWHKTAALYSLLIWPVPLLRLQSLLAQPLATMTAVVARPLASLLGAQMAPAFGNPAVFVGNGTHSWTIVIGDVCSGLNAALAVVLVCIPAAAYFRIPWQKACVWALGGVGLALLANVLRVTTLLVVASRYGSAFALGRVHPALGAAFLVVIFIVLWLQAPAVSPPPTTRLPGSPALGRSAAIAVAALAVMFAAGSSRLVAFDPLPPIGAPGGTVHEALDYLRLPPGWTIEAAETVSWQNLFGPESHSFALNLRASSGALVKAQYVATPDLRRLNQFGLEACRVYHGDATVGRRTVSLGAGSVASLVDTLERSPFTGTKRLSVLYWQAPFRVETRDYHARVALFIVQADEPQITTPAVNGTAPGGAEFDTPDTVLLDLARGITGQVLAASATTGTSA